jgi:hypothetical protein
VNSETRSIEVSIDHIMSAIEVHLKTMRLIADNETVFTYEPSSSDRYTIHLKKEV